MSQTTLLLLVDATFATIYMSLFSAFIATVIGLPLGVALFVTRPGNILQNKLTYRVLATLVNMTRSIPFVILMIAVIPFTRLVVGTSIGMNAAIVPLSLAAIPFVGRIVENALLEVNKGLIEAAIAMGANSIQIVTRVLLPEATVSIVNGLTLTLVSLIGYSAMAGAVGGGGLGDIAIRYGYHRFDIGIMLVTIAIMIILVQTVQWIGDGLAKHFSHYRN